MRLTKTLLAAAAFVGASTATTKAYDLYNSDWNYSQPGFSYGYPVGDDWYGREYRDLTNSRTLNAPFYHSNVSERDLVNAAVYRGIAGSFSWNGNEYNNWPDYDAAFVRGELQTGPDGEGFDAQGFFDYQDGYYSSGTFLFDSRDTTTNLAIRQTSYGIYMDTDGNYFGSNVSGEATVFERTVQVARTGSGFDGAFALSAFQSDNSETLSGSFYNASIVGRNVLPVAAAFFDAEGGVYGPSLNGSVIRQADIALGFGGDEGLFAKDGGWLDIRGDLTLGASGTIYIRDGEITSNIYTQFYTPGTLNTVGRLAIETGILSVREHFAQDMAATWGQTLGFRDGAVNETRLILEGVGYGNFDGEGEFLAYGPQGSSFGALRSITGENVQNGNISIVADGEGFFGSSNGAVIGTDLGSKLTINGTINGLNSGASEGGAVLGYYSEGETIQNGRILSGITDVLKDGAGELLINSSNLFTGNLIIQGGSVRITNSGALSGANVDPMTTDHTFVYSGASLVLDQANGLSLGDDFNITGTGTAEIGAALHNKSGANTTTGEVFLENGSATVRVDASSSLTVGSLDADSTAYVLTLDVRGADATVGSFVANGTTGSVGTIVKNGTGNATLAQVTASLGTVTVNGGKLEFLGSTSSAGSPHATGFNKYGVGTLEVRGTHFYQDFDIREGAATLFGSVTLDGTLDNGDFDLGEDTEGGPLSGSLVIESGATLTHDSADGLDPDANTNGMDIRNASSLTVKSGGVVQLNGAEIDLVDTATVTVAGVLSSRDGIYANNATTVTIQAGGVVNADIFATDSTTIAINGGDGEGLGAGVLNGDISANTQASITLGGVINGDVETYDDAELTLVAGAVHNGDYRAYGASVITINGSLDNNEGNPFGQNFSISGAALLKGSGTIGGDLTQTGGTVAPGNSTDVLTVLGNYSINAGSLQVEIGGTDGPGNDPTGNDQLAVAGTVTVGGTAILDFQPYNGYEAVRGGVFQVLATDTGAARATIGTFDTVDLTGLTNRVLFDHSTGKAYGTGLAKGLLGGTFRDYGDNANRREVGRALWMESIAKDNSGLDDNYGTGALDPLEAAANSGQKVFIQTRDASGLDATQVQTDLGAAAVSVLTAADAGAALDALSPEAYVGITELGVRVTRNFAQLPASKRKLAAANEWDFSVGYAGEQITADTGATGFTNYKVSSDQIHLTAAKDLSKNLRLTLAAGLDDGEVGAAGFTADTDTQAFGLGLGFTPDSKGWTADLGIALTRTDWDASRGVAQTGSDNEDGLGVALRLSLAPTVDGALSYAPYVGLSYATQDQSAVTEGGADNDGMVGVGFAGYERDSLVSELGLKAEYALKPGTTLTGVIAWEHEFEDSGETTLDAEFTENGVTDTRFAVTSAGFGADIFRVGVGVRVELGAKSAFSLGYDALLSSDAKSGQGIKADVSFRF